MSSSTFGGRRAFSGTMLTATFLATLALAGQAQAQNDNFASRITIGALPYTLTVSTTTATLEVGEVSACAGGHSVWWEYTAASSGMLVIDTNGSNHDTEVAIYTGPAVLASLQELDCNDDYVSLQGRISLYVDSGTTYYIRGSGYSSASGSYRLNLSTLSAPLYTQCPRVENEGGCKYLVTANGGGTFSVSHDSIQPAFRGLGLTPTAGFGQPGQVGVQNSSGVPLCNLGVAITQGFNFTLRGLCELSNAPGACPFGVTGSEGPGMSFLSDDIDFATLTFSPCIPSGSSGYFSVSGQGQASFAVCNADAVCDGMETCINCPSDCGECDADMDGEPDDSDNCASLANPNQRDIDGDSAGDVCDGQDNTLVIKSATLQTKPKGGSATIKGTIPQSSPLQDQPDASGGMYFELYDNFGVFWDATFTALECTQTEKKIACKTTDKLKSLSIKLSKADEGIVPFQLKLKEFPSPPVSYSPPVQVYLRDTGTQVDRGGAISACLAPEGKLVCKQE